MARERRTVLTGIKPTGSPHLGNYAGMMRPALEMVSRRADDLYLYFIADYHALNMVPDPACFSRTCGELAAAWLALGLDPDKVVFYRQSDIPEVFELACVLACVTPKGLMNRAHAYKAAVSANCQAGLDEDTGVNMGLYNYPILMAADILLFQADVVPVGEDQVQHVEMARDIAVAFNNVYGEVLKLPEAAVQQEVARLPGLDGRKMSKSCGNTIPLFAPPEEVRRLVFRMKTDSTAPDAPKDPDASALFLLYKEFASPRQVRAMRERYQSGAVSWHEAKEELCRVLEESLGESRRRYAELVAEPDYLETILTRGAERARRIAQPVLGEVRRAIGKERLQAGGRPARIGLTAASSSE